ncbi:MAG: peptidase S58 family protein [Gemmatimonadales bacterium]|nr:MAG: peptidase S58 family protein [Gemmatimonadales bacterium]
MRVSLPLPAGPRDDLADVAGIRIGHAAVEGGGSGCTVVLGPFRAAVEVAGHAAGSREFVTLDPAHVTTRADAIVLTGGSAFGLAAADGVMSWLEERGHGHPTHAGVVPIVPTAVIHDLAEGRRRPGPREGRAACEAALRAETPGAADGADSAGSGAGIGAGIGATVGKLLGMAASMPGGLGSASVRQGAWTLGALAVVNALGDVLGPDGNVVAGARPVPGAPPVDALATLLQGPGAGAQSMPGGNSTLCVIGTDAPLTDADLRRMLTLAATALPRRITPVFTPFDGDVIFGVVSGPNAKGSPVPLPPAELLLLGVAAREALERAILRAVGFVPGDADGSSGGRLGPGASASPPFDPAGPTT